MDSLVGYGSDDEGESGRFGYQPSGGGEGGARRRDDDTNYDDVNMDMSEESQGAESEPELPPAAPPAPPRPRAHAAARRSDSRERDRSRSTDERDRSRSTDSRDKRRDRPHERRSHERRSHERRSHERRSRESQSRERQSRERQSRERQSRERQSRERRSPHREERSRAPRRGLLGDRPDPRGAAPAAAAARAPRAPDAAQPRFAERRERERDRDGRPSRRSEEKRSGSPARRGPAAADYRPSSYKVNRKLEVMEKMGLQIKTPDGSMATARQLRAAAAPAGAPAAYALPAHRALDQVQKRKLLWGNKGAAAEAEAARWTGARFAQDADGKQVSKFMRLMGIKEPAAAGAAPADDPNKKQEELFSAMQAQYEVARAATHTMRGVGLGFQRGNC